MNPRLSAIIVVAGCLFAGGAPRERLIDERYEYRLTNSFLGDGYSLDNERDAPNAPRMAETGNYSGQAWKFTFQGGCYRLTNRYLGGEHSLDSHAGKDNALFMGDSGDFTGQCWHVSPENDGYVRFSNSYLGTSRSLDTRPDGQHDLFMGESGNYSGQLWKLTRFE